MGACGPPGASRRSARTSLRAPCILVTSPGCAEDVVKGLGQTVAPLVSSRPSGSLIVPVLPCREPEQLPGPHCEPASRKVGRVQAIASPEDEWRLRCSSALTWPAIVLKLPC